MAEGGTNTSENIEHLATTQKHLGEDIQKVLVNYRKDPAVRKTESYLEKRIKDLEDKWETFLATNKILEELKDHDPEHAYFTSNFYYKIEDTYNITKRILEAKLSEVLQSEGSAKTISSVEDASKSGVAQPSENQSKIQRQNATKALLIDFINKIQKEDLVAQPRAYYKHKIQMLHNYWSSMTSNHVHIMANLTAAKEDSEYLENNRYSQLEDIYQETVIALQTAHDDQQTELNINQPHPQKIKLPPLQVPTFDGDYKNWSSFQDLFKQLIHSNAGLGSAQKLYYLKSNLVGEASKMLQHLKVTDDNYNIAWELLNNRYNNTRLLVASQLQRLITFPMSQTESANNLKHLHDTAKECLGAIRNLKVKTDDWGPFLVHILTQKLDKESHKHYEERLKNPRDIQSLEEFFSFLEYRFQALETIGKKENTNQKTLRSSSHLINKSPKSKTTKPSSFTKTKDRCTLCKSNHRLYGCNSFRVMNNQKRREHVRKHNLCFNCLHSDHDVYNCKSRSSCKVCNKRHNTLLHPQEKQADNSSSEAAIAASTNTGKHESTPVRSHVAHAISTPPTTQIMLATAVVKVSTIHGSSLTLRALIDQGSQATFITENAAQQLGLKRSRVVINIDGIGNNCTETVRSSVQITIQPRFSSKFECRTTALIMKKLTNKIPAQPIQLENCAHMQDLVLADIL